MISRDHLALKRCSLSQVNSICHKSSNTPFILTSSSSSRSSSESLHPLLHNPVPSLKTECLHAGVFTTPNLIHVKKTSSSLRFQTTLPLCSIGSTSYLYLPCIAESQ